MINRALALPLLAVMACGTSLIGSKATVTIDGQTVTVSVGSDGTVCTTYAPPITYYGESCSVICQTKTAPFIDLTCTSSTGTAHTVALVRARP